MSSPAFVESRATIGLQIRVMEERSGTVIRRPVLNWPAAADEHLFRLLLAHPRATCGDTVEVGLRGRYPGLAGVGKWGMRRELLSVTTCVHTMWTYRDLQALAEHKTATPHASWFSIAESMRKNADECIMVWIYLVSPAAAEMRGRAGLRLTQASEGGLRPVACFEPDMAARVVAQTSDWVFLKHRSEGSGVSNAFSMPSEGGIPRAVVYVGGGTIDSNTCFTLQKRRITTLARHAARLGDWWLSVPATAAEPPLHPDLPTGPILLSEFMACPLSVTVTTNCEMLSVNNRGRWLHRLKYPEPTISLPHDTTNDGLLLMYEQIHAVQVDLSEQRRALLEAAEAGMSQ